MIASDVVRGLLVLALLFVRDLNAIYAILFVMSIFSSFFVPAQSVAVRTLAPAGGLLAVNALMSQAVQGSADHHAFDFRRAGRLAGRQRLLPLR